MSLSSWEAAQGDVSSTPHGWSRGGGVWEKVAVRRRHSFGANQFTFDLSYVEFEFRVDQFGAVWLERGFGADSEVTGAMCCQHQRVSTPVLRCSVGECGKDRGQGTRPCLVDRVTEDTAGAGLGRRWSPEEPQPAEAPLPGFPSS